MGKMFIDKSMRPYIEKDTKHDATNYSWIISPSHVCVYRTLFSIDRVSIPCVNKITITNNEIILTERANNAISINRENNDRVVITMDHHIVTIAIEPEVQSNEHSWPRIYESLNPSEMSDVYVRLNKDDYLRFLTIKSIYKKNQGKIRRKIKSTPIHVNDYLVNAQHIYIINDIRKDIFVMTDLINQKSVVMSIMDVFMSDLKVFNKRALFILKDRCIRCYTDYSYKDPDLNLYLKYDKYLKEMKRISKIESIKDLDLYKDFCQCECDIILMDKNRIHVLYATSFNKNI